MEIQQHDGVVVDVAGSRQGFAKHYGGGGRGVTGGRGRRQGLGCSCPPSPPLYIGARGRMPPWGQRRPLGFPTLGALGP